MDGRYEWKFLYFIIFYGGYTDKSGLCTIYDAFGNFCPDILHWVKAEGEAGTRHHVLGKKWCSEGTDAIKKKIWSVPFLAINRKEQDFCPCGVFWISRKFDDTCSFSGKMSNIHTCSPWKIPLSFLFRKKYNIHKKFIGIVWEAIYRMWRYGPDFLFHRVRTLAAPLLAQYIMPCACFSLFSPNADVRTKIPKGVINRHLCFAETFLCSFYTFIRIKTVLITRVFVLGIPVNLPIEKNHALLRRSFACMYNATNADNVPEMRVQWCKVNHK